MASLERTFATHFNLLRGFVANFVPPNRSASRDKLARLPPEQLLDVSTDLFDEVSRRLKEPPDVPFLPVRNDLLPTRNQARQKMATLPLPRLKELAAGICSEIEKRFPSIASEYAPSTSLSQPAPQQDDGMLSPLSPTSNQPRPPSRQRGVSRAKYDNDSASSSGVPSLPPSTADPSSARSYGAPSRYDRDRYRDTSSSSPMQSQDMAATSSRSSNARDRDHASYRSRDRSVDAERYRARDRSTDAEKYRSERSERLRSQERGKSASERTDSPWAQDTFGNIKKSSGAGDGTPTSDDIERIRSEYELKIAKLEKQLKDRDATDSHSQDRNRQYESRISELENMNYNLETRLAGLETNRRGADDETMQIRAEMKRAAEEFDARIRQLEVELAAKTEKLTETTKKMDQIRIDYEALQDDYDQQHKISDSIRAEATSLLEEVKALTTQVDELSSERDKYLSENDKLKAEMDRMTKDMDDLRAELDRAKNDHALAKTDLEQARRDLSNMSRSPLNADGLSGNHAQQSLPTPAQPSPSFSQKQPSSSTSKYPGDKENAVSATNSHPGKTGSTPISVVPGASASSTSGEDLETRHDKLEKTIDDLISAARSDPASAVLQPMKAILALCKSIMHDGEMLKRNSKTHPDDQEQLGQLKDKASDAIKHLMAATKDHASSGGSRSSADLVEDEAVALSYAMRDLVDLILDIDPSLGRGNDGKGPSGSSSSGPPKPAIPAIVGANDDGYPDTLPRDPTSKAARRDTWKDRSPRDAMPNGSGGNSAAPSGLGGASPQVKRQSLPPMDLNDLRFYVEEQIDVIAHTIQDLLQTMRNPQAVPEDMQDLINEIANFVDNIIYETRATITQPDTAASGNLPPATRTDVDGVLGLLTDARDALLDLSDAAAQAPADKSVKQKIANSSYEVAKHAKELLRIIG